jgi:hypothetical protein
MFKSFAFLVMSTTIFMVTPSSSFVELQWTTEGERVCSSPVILRCRETLTVVPTGPSNSFEMSLIVDVPKRQTFE